VQLAIQRASGLRVAGEELSPLLDEWVGHRIANCTARLQHMSLHHLHMH
jgi:hypothetical protein